MSAGPSIFGMIIGFAVACAVYTLIGALILRISCRIVDTHVPKFGRACFVTLLAFIGFCVITVGLNILFAIFMGTMIPDPDATISAPTNPMIIMAFVSIAMQIALFGLLSATLYKIFVPLPTFGRAVLVFVLSLLMWLGIAVIIGGVMAGVNYYRFTL